jgi:hypothetical protein
MVYVLLNKIKISENSVDSDLTLDFTVNTWNSYKSALTNKKRSGKSIKSNGGSEKIVQDLLLKILYEIFFLCIFNQSLNFSRRCHDEDRKPSSS